MKPSINAICTCIGFGLLCGWTSAHAQTANASAYAVQGNITLNGLPLASLPATPLASGSGAAPYGVYQYVDNLTAGPFIVQSANASAVWMQQGATVEARASATLGVLRINLPNVLDIQMEEWGSGVDIYGECAAGGFTVEGPEYASPGTFSLSLFGIPVPLDTFPLHPTPNYTITLPALPGLGAASLVLNTVVSGGNGSTSANLQIAAARLELDVIGVLGATQHLSLTVGASQAAVVCQAAKEIGH